MHIAKVLSDLTSLRVCGPTEALALVRASSSATISAPSRERGSSHSAAQSPVEPSSAAEEKRPSKSEEENDPDIRRVYELMELHDLVKKRYGEGRDSDLEKARREVDELLRNLNEEDI